MQRGDPFYDTNQHVGGYGYYKKAIIGRSTTFAYTYIGIALYDANTMKRLAGRGKWENNSSSLDIENISRSDVNMNQDEFKQLFKRNIENLLKVLKII